jgi:hypothetical protein
MEPPPPPPGEEDEQEVPRIARAVNAILPKKRLCTMGLSWARGTVGDLCAKVAQVITGQTFLSAMGHDWHDRHLSVAYRFS